MMTSRARRLVMGASIFFTSMVAVSTLFLWGGGSTSATSTAGQGSLYAVPAPRNSLEMAANGAAVTPPSPWFKLDFIVPACETCSCGAFNVQTAIKASEQPASGLEEAYGLGPLFQGVRPSLATRSWRLEDAVAVLRHSGGMPSTGGFVVNIGAACMLHGYGDPTLGLLHGDESVGALLLDKQTKANLFSGYPLTRSNVRLMTDVFLAPQTIKDLVRQAGVPDDLTVLKVDIDSWDLGLLAALVEEKPLELLPTTTTTTSSGKFRPLLIHMEVNTVFPPPLRFTVPLDMSQEEVADYAPEIWASNSPYYGASLAAAADVLIPRGYTLLEVDGWDATWVRTDVSPAFSSVLHHNLTSAFYHGFTRFVEAEPSCFQGLKKVHVPEIAALAKRVAAAQEAHDQPALLAAMAELQPLLLDGAPRHKSTNVPLRGRIEYSGLAGDSTGWLTR